MKQWMGALFVTVTAGALAACQSPESPEAEATARVAAPIRNAALTWTERQELFTSDPTDPGIFGASVAVDGDTAVVGAQRGGGDTVPGAAYIFTRTGATWVLQQELSAQQPSVGDGFGTSVAVSGNTVVVGAPGTGSAPGAVDVFVRSGSVWTLQQEISNGIDFSEFGWSVGVSGNTLVAGAPFGPGFGDEPFQGAAYVFVRDHGTWTQQQHLTSGVAEPICCISFGFSVAISGDTVVAGAPVANSFAGAAYVFTRSQGAWSAPLLLPDPAATPSDNFGNSVAVSGDTALIGANGAQSQTGAAYVFVRAGATWIQQQQLVASDGFPGATFGNRVALGGDTAVVGAFGSLQAPDQGAAYAFVRSQGTWAQQELFAHDRASGDNFGYNVAVSMFQPDDRDFSLITPHDTVLVSAPTHVAGPGTGFGTVYVFTPQRGRAALP